MDLDITILVLVFIVEDFTVPTWPVVAFQYMLDQCRTFLPSNITNGLFGSIRC